MAQLCNCSEVYHLPLGFRSVIALLGYLIMQIGLWYAENRWDDRLKIIMINIKLG